MNLIIHAGYMKTGSTSLQSSLFNNRELLENNNYIYPEIGLRLSCHHGILDAFMFDQTDVLENYFNQLNQIEDKTVILSSEIFSILTLEKVKKLSESLNFDSVRVIFYQRNFMDYIFSTWVQSLVHGSTKNFSEFYNTIYDPPEFEEMDHLLDFDSTYKKWANCFSRESIEIYLYDDISNIADHFFKEVLKINDDICLPKRLNQSLDTFSCEFRRIINTTNLAPLWLNVDESFVHPLAFPGSENAHIDNANNIFHNQLKEVKEEIRIKAKPYVSTITITFGEKLLNSTENHLLLNWKSNIINCNHNNVLYKVRSKEFQYVNSDFCKFNKDIKNEIDILILKIYQFLPESEKDMLKAFYRSKFLRERKNVIPN